MQEKSQELEQQRQKNGTLSVQAYAVRFLKCNKTSIFVSQADVPLTPDRVSDSGVTDLSWENSLTEVWIVTQYLDTFVSYESCPIHPAQAHACTHPFSQMIYLACVNMRRIELIIPIY